MPSFVAPPQSFWEKFMEPIPNDPAVDESRKIRHRISDRCNHDPAQLVAFYMKLQEVRRASDCKS
jgi:hypothetical protein